MNVTEITLDDWLQSTEERRNELAAYGKTPLPADVGERHADLDQAIRASDDAGRLLADAESFLAQHFAQSVLSMRERYPDLTAKEREAIVRAEVRDIQRIVDSLSISVRTIKNRIMVNLNENRAR